MQSRRDGELRKLCLDSLDACAGVLDGEQGDDEQGQAEPKWRVRRDHVFLWGPKCQPQYQRRSRNH
jgi:hypothetical protein